MKYNPPVRDMWKVYKTHNYFALFEPVVIGSHTKTVIIRLLKSGRLTWPAQVVTIVRWYTRKRNILTIHNKKCVLKIILIFERNINTKADDTTIDTIYIIVIYRIAFENKRIWILLKYHFWRRQILVSEDRKIKKIICKCRKDKRK